MNNKPKNKIGRFRNRKIMDNKNNPKEIEINFILII